MAKRGAKVFVAMSGGVDSSVAALLLQRQGYDVTGVFMKNWSDPLADECPWETEARDFVRVCKKLKIPYRIETFEAEYREKVVEYLIRGYRRGITPNPDMLCNREIKFKVFLDTARSLGADYIATGHYARIEHGRQGEYTLRAALDMNKDQSYFLALLKQPQLRQSMFPIGQLKKPEVRAIAKRAGLSVHDKKDSQGICFIGKVSFKNFIRKFIPPKPGPIALSTGKRIGRHDGLAFYTIGQRHGLGIGGGVPYYVVDKEFKTNTLVVCRGERSPELFKRSAELRDFSWVGAKPKAKKFSCRVRIRYRQPLQSCLVALRGSKVTVTFKHPQRAVTPGQFAVLYRASQILGGGVIRV